jgi:hypothetical protein
MWSIRGLGAGAAQVAGFAYEYGLALGEYVPDRFAQNEHFYQLVAGSTPAQPTILSNTYAAG